MSDVYVEHDIEIALSKERERNLLFNMEEILINFMLNQNTGNNILLS